MQAFYRDLSYPYGLENALRLAGALEREVHTRSDETIAEPNPSQPHPSQTHPSRALGRTNTTTRGHIVVVDDDEAIRHLFTEALQRNGFTVTCRQSLQDDAHDFDLIANRADALILDRHIGPDDGLAFLQRLRREIPILPVVLISGHPLTRAEQRQLASLNADFFPKPFQVKELIQFLTLCLSDTPSSAL